MIRTLATLGVFASTLFAQRSVPPEFMYHHVWAVVPIVGAGTKTDPQRPMLVPAASSEMTAKVPAQAVTVNPDGKVAVTAQVQRPDLLSYQMQLSDDGKFALVEFVFESPLGYQRFLAKAATAPGTLTRPPALQPVAADGSNIKSVAANTAALKAAFESSVTGLKLFERGKASQQEILAEFRKHKANFKLGTSVEVQ